MKVHTGSLGFKYEHLHIIEALGLSFLSPIDWNAYAGACYAKVEFATDDAGRRRVEGQRDKLIIHWRT